MILDAQGTAFRSGRLVIANEWRRDKNMPLQWWTPQGDKTTYKVCIHSVASGAMLWQRPFDTLVEALKFKTCFDLHERVDCPSFDVAVRCEVKQVSLWLNVGTRTWVCPDGTTPLNKARLIFPPGDPQHDPELWQALVASYTTSNTSSPEWPNGNTAPGGVSKTDYLVVAGGGGGGGSGGGGGAGGLLTDFGYQVAPGYAYTITVGGAGTAGSGGFGGDGGNSVFSALTSIGGGGGGFQSNNGRSGGSGGGAGYNNPGPVTGGSGTAGQGNAGGNGSGSANFGEGGGGGASAAGTNGLSSGTPSGTGGAGLSSSISGLVATYAGGGGGGGVTNVGTGGAGGGGAGGTGSGTGTNATANTGGGGGGGGPGGAATNAGGAGGAGIVILAYAPTSIIPFLRVTGRR